MAVQRRQTDCLPSLSKHVLSVSYPTFKKVECKSQLLHDLYEHSNITKFLWLALSPSAGLLFLSGAPKATCATFHKLVLTAIHVAKLKHKHMHLLQVQIYAWRGMSFLFLPWLFHLSIFCLCTQACMTPTGRTSKHVCFLFQFYQEELGQERLRIEQEMQVGSEFWFTKRWRQTSWPFRCCFKALHWGSEQHHRYVKHLLTQCSSNKIHFA